ncbi:hypothetical protein D915_004552 [Fasciola hepatica]|uniref:Uncharacterized protein n=1 Tax=Fasciola hepatica TaxID=6192 RepID=A0A4E0S160_FASHE|nr:hypothetical protein D915_004552 [Fasciola hepatica]
MHQSYHPLIIEAISNQLSLIREMAEILEDLTEARMTHIEAVKAVCNKIQNSSTEFDRKKTSYFPATLEDFRNSFLDHLRSEVELQEKALKETRTRVIEPLMCILMHKRSQVSRLDAFRRNADNCLQEASDMTAALHADYCEIYQANRETLQLKTIKDILNWHNEYVLQLHMTNTMKEHYHAVIIPQLMQVRMIDGVF